MLPNFTVVRSTGANGVGVCMDAFCKSSLNFQTLSASLDVFIERIFQKLE